MKCQSPACSGITGVSIRLPGPPCGKIYGFPCEVCGLLHWPNGTPMLSKDNNPLHLRDGIAEPSSNVWPLTDDGSKRMKCLDDSCCGELSNGYLGATIDPALIESGCDVLLVSFRRCKICGLLHSSLGSLLLVDGKPKHLSEAALARIKRLA